MTDSVESVLQKSREEFEKAAENEGLLLMRYSGRFKLDYQNHRTQEAWEFWQASRSALEPMLAELIELKAWKESAMLVLGGIDLQSVAKQLGLPLGSDIGPAILPAIKRLQDQQALSPSATPAPIKLYEHHVFCNGDRRFPPGTKGKCCGCKTIMEELAKEAATTGKGEQG